MLNLSNFKVSGGFTLQTLTTTGNILSILNSNGDITSVSPSSIITSGGGVTGTGASGRLALWNGTGTQTSSANLAWSATTIELGKGSDAAYGILIGKNRSTNGFSYIDLVGDLTYVDYGLRFIRRNDGENAASQMIHRGTGPFILSAYEAGDILFQTNSIDRGVIKGATGYLGVLTTTPNAPLQVNGNANLNGLMIGRAYGSPAFVPYPLASDPDAYVFLASDDGNNVIFNKVVTGTGSIGFRIGNSEKMALLENGNFGIGLTPAYPLQVLGKGEINGLKIGKLHADFPGIVATSLHDADPDNYNFIASSNGNYVLINKVSTGTGYLGLRTGNVNRLTIDEAGSVTINALATTAGYVTNDASGNLSTATASATASALNYWTLSGSDVYRSTGDVIIGSGSLFLANNQSIGFKDNLGGYKVIQTVDAFNTTLFRSAGGGLYFQNLASSNLLVMNENGNVGIGLSPTYKLHLQYSSATGAFPFAITNGSINTLALGGTATGDEGNLYLNAPAGQGPGAGIQFSSAGGVKNGLFQLDSGGNMVFRQSQSDMYFDYYNRLFFRSNSGASIQAVLTNDGNVGIGEPYPNKNLVIKGTTNAYVALRSAAGSQALTEYVDGVSQKWSFGKNNDNGFILYDNIANRTVFNAESNGNLSIFPTTGDVGIGTVAPTYRLHSVSSDFITASFEGDNNNGANIFLNSSTTAGQRQAGVYTFSAGGNKSLFFGQRQYASDTFTVQLRTGSFNASGTYDEILSVNPTQLSKTSTSNELYLKLDTSNSTNATTLQGRLGVRMFAQGYWTSFIEGRSYSANYIHGAVVIGAASNMTSGVVEDRMYISGDTGNVGIGSGFGPNIADRPLAKFHVKASTTTSGRFESTGTDTEIMLGALGQGTDLKFWGIYNDGTTLKIRTLVDAISSATNIVTFNRAGNVTLNAYGAGVLTTDSIGSISAVASYTLHPTFEKYDTTSTPGTITLDLTSPDSGFDATVTIDTANGIDVTVLRNGVECRRVTGTPSGNEYKILTSTTIQVEYTSNPEWYRVRKL